MEDKLSRIEEIIENVRRENEERNEKIEKEKDRRRKIVDSRKLEEIKKKKLEEDKQTRIEVKKKLEEKWALLRWTAEYIEENKERWKTDKNERNIEEKLRIKDWERNSRLDKIKIIKERMRKGEKKETEKEKAERLSSSWKSWRKITTPPEDVEEPITSDNIVKNVVDSTVKKVEL